ncbi:Zinc finger protein 609 [Heterocephalus glaber]|uniref:Zinc finger protein 609 n=1 Tax=Heterocephalus glaber TaxID=10181 RepID=G5BRN8_HETGA|nr:Zinc finger protein 609 [Heterocephalus glaber]
MEGLLNGSSDPHQSSLASIKAEADKIYSFTDNAPSPSIRGGSRLDSTSTTQPLTPLHVVMQNGAEVSSVKTNSPGYSYSSDSGEDGEGKVDSLKSKDWEQLGKEGAKKTLFAPQPQSKDSPYYQGFERYYSPSYTQSSPRALNPGSQVGVESQALKPKKEEEPDSLEGKGKSDLCEEKKPELSSSPSSSSAPTCTCSRCTTTTVRGTAEAPGPGATLGPDKKAKLGLKDREAMLKEKWKQKSSIPPTLTKAPSLTDLKAKLGLKDREAMLKEKWKQKSSIPPTLTKAPSLTDLVKSGLSKAKEPGAYPAKSVIIPKLDDASKLPSHTPEGLKVKLSEANHLGK